MWSVDSPGNHHSADQWRSAAALGHALRKLGHYYEAEAVFRQLVSARIRHFGADHPETLSAQHDLASVLRCQHHHRSESLEECQVLLRAVLSRQQRSLGRDHPDTLRSLSSLASTLHVLGRNEEAARLAGEAAEVSSKILGSNHPDTLGMLHNWAIMLVALARFSDAESPLKAAREGRFAVLGDDRVQDTAKSSLAWASLLCSLRRWGEAAAVYRSLWEARREFPNDQIAQEAFRASLRNSASEAQGLADVSIGLRGLQHNEEASKETPQSNLSQEGKTTLSQRRGQQGLTLEAHEEPEELPVPWATALQHQQNYCQNYLHDNSYSEAPPQPSAVPPAAAAAAAVAAAAAPVAAPAACQLASTLCEVLEVMRFAAWKFWQRCHPDWSAAMSGLLRGRRPPSLSSLEHFGNVQGR